MSSPEYIAQNLNVVRQEIAAAEQKTDREGGTRMLAAVKYGSDEELQALLQAGVRDVGENRVQQLLAHWPIYEACGTRVHFIGTLQTNKVKYIIDKVAMIHSVDSLRLAETINRQAMQRELVMDVLVEINGAREEAKSGIMPEEAAALCREILQLTHLRLRGFMTMGPRFEDDDAYQRYFASVKEIGDGIWRALGIEGQPLYSMGMSESFVPAILAGADMVRIGRRLFRLPDGAANDQVENR